MSYYHEPFMMNVVYVSLSKALTEELPIIDHTPHYPQPDDFNKANWKTLPRIIREDQVTYHTENDDLPLNIFSPSISGNAPVVVYVHGGSLLIGGASSYDGHDTVQIGFDPYWYDWDENQVSVGRRGRCCCLNKLSTWSSWYCLFHWKRWELVFERYFTRFGSTWLMFRKIWFLFFLIWLSRKYDSTMVQHNQNANGPIRVHNLAPPRQPN